MLGIQMKQIELVAAVIRKGSMVFATRCDNGEFKNLWEFPGGEIAKGESAQQTLTREIKEKFEADIVVGELLRTVECDCPEFHLTLHCFWCELASEDVLLHRNGHSAWLEKDSLHSLEWMPAVDGILDDIPDDIVKDTGRKPSTAGNSIKGYLFGAAAAVSYGLNPAFTLPLYADGMNPESVLLLRYGFAIVILVFLMLFCHSDFAVKKRTLPSLFILGLLMAASSLFLFISYNYMAAGIASTILFVYPIFVAVIMALVYKEKLTLSTALCLSIATAGILLLYNTGDGDTLSLFGTVSVIVSALSYAFYLVLVGKGKIAAMSSLTVTFYVLCFGSLLFISTLLVKDEPLTLPSKWYLWLDAFALALFPTAISLLCTKLAINTIGSTPTAILGALEPVTAVFVGLLFFGEGMTGREAVGIVLILLAVTIVVGRKKHRP